MRNPVRVTQQILKVVPEKHKETLEWCEHNFRYKAPELWPECFQSLTHSVSHILKDETGDFHPVENWHFKICSILSTKTVKELKDFYK